MGGRPEVFEGERSPESAEATMLAPAPVCVEPLRGPPGSLEHAENSCYLSSLLWSMFATTDVYDELLTFSPPSEVAEVASGRATPGSGVCDRLALRDHIREHIVSPLRRHEVVPAFNVEVLPQVHSQLWPQPS